VLRRRGQLVPLIAALLAACVDAPGSPGASLVLPSADTAVPPVGPPGARRLDLEPDTCLDDRYPALAGDWAVGCSEAGLVDLAEHVETGLRVVLSRPAAAPGLADGALFAPGRAHGVWRLPDPNPQPAPPEVADPPVAPPAFDGRHVALSFADGVDLYALGDTVRRRIPGRPMPWRAPVLVAVGDDGPPAVAWVDAEGPRLHLRGVTTPLPDADRTRPFLAGGTGLAWRTPHGLRVAAVLPTPADPLGAEEASWSPAGFVRAAVGPRSACLEVDEGVRCTDADGTWPGQSHPSRNGRWVLTRGGGAVWLTRLDPQ